MHFFFLHTSSYGRTITLRVWFSMLTFMGICCTWAQEVTDSARHMSEVMIVAKRIENHGAGPAQELKGRELKELSVYSVADALRYFSGVQVKDYGGVGGLKTVNIRSLGTNHTGVFLNGIQLGNAQNGQIDLGRFSMDNMEALQMYNGQKSSALQTAKDFASASAIYMRTRKPYFIGTEKGYRCNVGMKVGSFDTYNPTLIWEQRLSDKVSAMLSAEYMTTSGKYPFSYAKKNGYDTTEVRKNGDVMSLRIETMLAGEMQGGEWCGQLYFYDSERGFPGASVREEPGKFRHQDRQWDTSVFAQCSWQKRFTKRYQLMFNGKVAWDYLHYLSDPNLDITTMYTDNEYRQTEAYLSASHQFGITPWLKASLANDVQYNYLDANLTNFVYPWRWTVLSALAMNVEWKGLTAQASLLHTWVKDEASKVGSVGLHKSVFTPSVVVAYKAMDDKRGMLNIRAFYKRIFRMPTFNDLYYTFIGNKALKPEYTTQYNIGLNYNRTMGQGWLRRLEWQTDAYFNLVEDKIVAMPTSNQFRWTMMNFGLCHIWGVETSLKASWQIKRVGVGTSLTYTFNRAMDKTDRQSEFYGGQLPYIPWHAFSAIVSAEYRGWRLNYSFIYTGERYESSANIPENYSQPWYTSDLGLSKQFRIKKVALRVSVEVCNIFNQQYEVVQCYPMPGTNFKTKLNVEI